MTQQEAIDKAIKLLRLSKSSNVHEAALAASRAQEIIDRFKLDITDMDFENRNAKDDNEPIKDFGYGDPLDKTSYLKPWMLRLASVVADANQCRIVYARIDEMGDGRNRGAVIKIIGRPSDVNVTRYLHGYLRGEVVRLRDENCAGNSGTYKRQFCLGVVETISAKLREQKKAMESDLRNQHSHNPMALVRVNNAIVRLEKRHGEVQKWVEANLKLGHGRVHGTARTGEGDSARAHGRKVGEQVRFTKARGAIGHTPKMIGGGGQ